MGRFIVRSFFEDIKNFKNMIPYRREKIEQAPARALPSTYGVNKLSEVIHPDKQRVTVSSCETIDSKMKIITFSACDNGTLATFRAGQGVNIKIGTETMFFPFLSAPTENKYSIIVHNDFSDGVSKFLSAVQESTELEISGPTGLFYYSSLRDGDSVVIICDASAVAPVISICRYLANSDNKNVKVFLLDEEENPKIRSLFKNMCSDTSVYYVKNEDEVFRKVSSHTDSVAAFFVSGKQEFCRRMESDFDSFEFLKGRIRTYISAPTVNRDVPSKKYYCQVLYRNDTFSFSCFADETLLNAFERNNIPTKAKCKVGECGYCRCKLLEGEVETVLCNGINSVRSADEKYGFIHPCRSFPKTDIKVRL